MVEKWSPCGLLAIDLVYMKQHREKVIAHFILVSCQEIGTKKYFKFIYSIFSGKSKMADFNHKMIVILIIFKHLYA